MQSKDKEKAEKSSEQLGSSSKRIKIEEDSMKSMCAFSQLLYFKHVYLFRGRPSYRISSIIYTSN